MKEHTNDKIILKAYINNNLVLNNVVRADTFSGRLKGLLGKDSLNSGEGLLLINCSSIHCFFMKFTIDAVYLTEDMVVLHKETLKPWEMGKIIKNTRNILEMQEGESKNIEVGDTIQFRP